MSDFITTMTARAMGEIPTVEPLLYSMYLKLPMIPGDYTEDTLSEPEPSAFINDEPNLSFKPLVTSKGFSATMPRWDANPDLELEPKAPLEDDSQYDVTPDSRINIETENTFNENSQEENDHISQPVTEISEYPIAPQINRLEATSQSVEANVEFNLTTSTNKSQSQPDDIEFPVDKQSIDSDNGEIISEEIPRGNNNQAAANSNNLNREAGILPNILPQVNHLETASQSVEANVEFNLTTSTNKSQSQPDDIEFPVDKQSIDSDNGEIISEEIPRGNNNQAAANSNNLNREAGILPNILPQVNHLETASQSVEANVEFNLTTSTNESQLQSDNIEFPINKQSIDSDNGEIISKQIPRGNNNQSAANSNNLNSEAGILPNILPQVNHLETASQSVEANVEFNLTTSTNESQSKQNLKKIDKSLREQLTNTQNLPTQKAPEIDKLEISSIQNPSNDNTRNQQTQKVDGVNQKKIVEKTVIPKLTNNSQLTNQIKPSLKKRTLLPQVNRVETAKSVKPDIQLDTTQLKLQNPLQQQRSIYQGEKTTTKEIVKTQTKESSPSQFNNNSQSPTPTSSQQQSIEPNLHLRSNLVNQHLSTDKEITVIATIGSNPKLSENRNEFVSPINHKHRNTEFVEKSETQSSISRVTPNLSEQKPVIPPGEDSVSLLPSPIVKTSSPIHTQTEFRRHQAETQPSPTIEVTIGRIEVRGIKPEPSPKSQGRKSTRKSPALSLSDYLKQRNGK